MTIASTTGNQPGEVATGRERGAQRTAWRPGPRASLTRDLHRAFIPELIGFS